MVVPEEEIGFPDEKMGFGEGGIPCDRLLGGDKGVGVPPAWK
jgi:hypothetical protein